MISILQKASCRIMFRIMSRYLHCIANLCFFVDTIFSPQRVQLFNNCNINIVPIAIYNFLIGGYKCCNNALARSKVIIKLIVMICFASGKKYNTWWYPLNTINNFSSFLLVSKWIGGIYRYSSFGIKNKKNILSVFPYWLLIFI